jgi:hypothetical protein
MYLPASSRTTSWRPLGRGIGSSNGWFQPLGELREEISALLREGKISAGRMHGYIAALDSQLHGGGVLVVTAACGNELQIDGADLHPAGMVGLNPVGYLQQRADCSVGIGERARCDEFHGLGIP